MIKCLLIDSNRTIENDESFSAVPKTYFNKIANILGCQSSEIFDFWKNFIQIHGQNVWEYHEIFWRSLVNKFSYDNSRKKIDELYECFLEFYEENIEIYPEVLDALDRLSQEYKLVMVANGNSKRIEKLIQKYNLNKYFSDFVISSETPYRKPDSFMFQYACKMYGIKNDETVMIGDRIDNDMVCPKKHGFRTVLIDRKKSFITIGEESDFVVPDLLSVCELLNKLNTNNLVALRSAFLLQNNLSTNDLTAFVAAGGKGSRLGELGTHTQKCMLEIWGGNPILYYVISTLKCIGCKKIVIAVSHLKEQIIDYFGDGSKFGVEIEYAVGEYISTYDALYSNLPLLSDKFIYIHGDILVNPELILDVLIAEKYHNLGCVGVIYNKNIHLTHAQMDVYKDRVINIDLTERDEHFPYTFIGVGVYNKRDFINNFDGTKTGMVEKYIFQKLGKGIKTGAVIYDGQWRHFETQSDYLRAKEESEWAILYKGEYE